MGRHKQQPRLVLVGPLLTDEQVGPFIDDLADLAVDLYLAGKLPQLSPQHQAASTTSKAKATDALESPAAPRPRPSRQSHRPGGSSAGPTRPGSH